MSDLTGKVAIVTGSTKGIGRAIAEHLLEAGASVVVNARSAGPVEAIALALGDRVLGIVADVGDAIQCQRLVDETVEHFGRLDILVNNAGLGIFKPLSEMTVEEWQLQVDVNLGSVFYCSKAALPHLRRNGGVVLNISATLHYLGTPAQLHVASAKAGVDALTRVLAVEWGPYGIRVNGIAPGPIADTEGVRRLLDDAAKQRAEKTTPLQRLGLVEDVSNAALFLCSQAASYITGATLVVDGGLWLTSSRHAFAPPPEASPGG